METPADRRGVDGVEAKRRTRHRPLADAADRELEKDVLDGTVVDLERSGGPVVRARGVEGDEAVGDRSEGEGLGRRRLRSGRARNSVC